MFFLWIVSLVRVPFSLAFVALSIGCLVSWTHFPWRHCVLFAGFKGRRLPIFQQKSAGFLGWVLFSMWRRRSHTGPTSVNLGSQRLYYGKQLTRRSWWSYTIQIKCFTRLYSISSQNPVVLLAFFYFATVNFDYSSLLLLFICNLYVTISTTFQDCR